MFSEKLTYLLIRFTNTNGIIVHIQSKSILLLLYYNLLGKTGM